MMAVSVVAVSVLVIGDGAREQASALSKLPCVKQVYVTMSSKFIYGNPGTAIDCITNNFVVIGTSYADVVLWCRNKSINLVVVGSEAYLGNVVNGSSYAYVLLWCKINSINFVKVGSEAYLANGLTDHLTSVCITCFGPDQEDDTFVDFISEDEEMEKILLCIFGGIYETAEEAPDHIDRARFLSRQYRI
ncbi:hypothetical protein JTE90_007412 [Oedothorax gibbosus]|uniref:Phosphoribosylglycinamide synthetase N-terminal domain-containing protein n=1 Tax=Oedothorax gibbosus TaxID=931172 RepID=A0AAV6TW60_9ARAC|nr:hypothetical protein JTE90_007412 [Oedothorax gibbosus]